MKSLIKFCITQAPTFIYRRNSLDKNVLVFTPINSHNPFWLPEFLPILLLQSQLAEYFQITRRLAADNSKISAWHLWEKIVEKSSFRQMRTIKL
jgi:hypothetical protein